MWTGISHQNNQSSQVPVAHVYNPSYSERRDQEDQGSKAAQTVPETLSQKYPTQKRVEYIKW
jgi:hypothetical protein